MPVDMNGGVSLNRTVLAEFQLGFMGLYPRVILTFPKDSHTLRTLSLERKWWTALVRVSHEILQDNRIQDELSDT